MHPLLVVTHCCLVVAHELFVVVHGLLMALLVRGELRLLFDDECDCSFQFFSGHVCPPFRVWDSLGLWRQPFLSASGRLQGLSQKGERGQPWSGVKQNPRGGVSERRAGATPCKWLPREGRLRDRRQTDRKSTRLKSRHTDI